MLIRAYSGTENLGDAIQTIALQRLLSGVTKCVDLSKEVDISYPLLINGWLGRGLVLKNKAVFAGVYLKENSVTENFLSWMEQSGGVVGARDAVTWSLLTGRKIAVKFCGCASLTFSRYDGRRNGIVHIDDESPKCLTNAIHKNMSWKDQWNEARLMLHRMKTAKEVHTCRLHVVLPCLAMGTPVFYHDPKPIDKYGGDVVSRFSIFTAMGTDRLHLKDVDVSFWANSYRNFLKDSIGELQEKELEETTFPDIIN
jgi:hypothetical protein